MIIKIYKHNKSLFINTRMYKSIFADRIKFFFRAKCGQLGFFIQGRRKLAFFRLSQVKLDFLRLGGRKLAFLRLGRVFGSSSPITSKLTFLRTTRRYALTFHPPVTWVPIFLLSNDQ